MKYFTWKIRTALHRVKGPKVVNVYESGVALRFSYERTPFIPASAYKGEYEPAETRFLIANATQFSSFVNIGANAGWFAIIGAKMGLRSIAVEPDKLNFSLLSANKKKNNLSNLEIHNVACSDEEKSSFLFGGNTGASLIKGWAGQPEEARRVKLVPFDRLISRRDATALIYIDVEGAELEVLRGMTDYLSSLKRAAIMVEITFGQHQPTSYNTTRKQTFELLTELSFEPMVLKQDGTLRPYFNWDEQIDGANYVFTKSFIPN